MQIENVGVVGAGTMGNGIAQVFAAAGFSVLMHDVDEASLQRGMGTIGKSLDRLLKKERIIEQDKNETLANIQVTTRLEQMEDVDLVVEAASEKYEVKASIFRSLDQYCKPEAILASNTSSISLTLIAGETKRSERVIGMHFMNPVPMMKLIEVIRALQTDDEVNRLIHELSKQIGKTPVAVNDSPGFVSNRILLPMINEAIFTRQEGVASVEAIDEVMKRDCPEFCVTVYH
ncbi:MAG: 3-hydroxybutyryl-CoA dehydrogenase [Candidatus Thiodiazotropha sp. (ex Rostrolucina anterorostrata)]|nr:3-hydroxybutyryl-CoA dehydrogenase [Candidatus Thiodiazotropha sp. (ex Rostrolucina anterorostrata)]